MSLEPGREGVDAAGANPRILVVDDDPGVTFALKRLFEFSHMPTVTAGSLAEAARRLDEAEPSVVLVDLDLPDGNGLDLIRTIRDSRRCGIIVLTGNLDETERIVGLKIGADDYITKPPNNRELIARIRSVHRRVHGAAAPAPAAPSPRPVVPRAVELPRHIPAEAAEPGLRVGQVGVDLALGAIAAANGAEIALTTAEVEVLRVLAAARGDVVSRDSLSTQVLRRPWRHGDRSIDQLVFLLRRKFTEAGAPRNAIRSVRANGYLLSLSPPPA